MYPWGAQISIRRGPDRKEKHRFQELEAVMRYGAILSHSVDKKELFCSIKNTDIEYLCR
jgi:hypothetical protein